MRFIASILGSLLAGRLRFPQLFVLTAGLFVIDLLIPDLIPFLDEIVLGLASLLFGSWKAGPKDKLDEARQDEEVIITPARVVDSDRAASKDRPPPG